MLRMSMEELADHVSMRGWTPDHGSTGVSQTDVVRLELLYLVVSSRFP